MNNIEELGPAIREALTHRSIKGKFDGVSPLLKEAGYSRVIVTDAGLKFISAKDGKDKCNEQCQKIIVQMKRKCWLLLSR